MDERVLAQRDGCVSAPVRVSGRGRATARGRAQAGFSLVELMVVCAIIAIVAGLALASFSGRDQAGRLASDVARRVRERRASAIRLNALTEPTLLENFRQPPVFINFSNLPTTAPLVVEGANRTTFNPSGTPGGFGIWAYVYQGTQLSLPSGWRIAATAADLAPIPTIPLGTPATVFSFTADGRLATTSLPAASPNTNVNVESPFPALYLTDGRAARAVAVHPSGVVEIWQYDEATGAWRGFGNRSVVAPGS